MSQYFDKDFFKFFLGFVSIISISIIIIFVTRVYQEEARTQTANVIETVKN
jgi:hypothetical protein